MVDLLIKAMIVYAVFLLLMKKPFGAPLISITNFSDKLFGSL